MMKVKIFLTKITVPMIMEASASKILGRWLESQVLFYESGGFDAGATDDDVGQDVDDDVETIRLNLDDGVSEAACGSLEHHLMIV